MTMWIVYPWAATRLWNGRWNHMSFGPLPFRTDLTADGLKRRWAAVFLVPIAVLIVAGVVVAAIGVAAMGADGKPSPSIMGVIVGLFLLAYLIIPLMTLHWYAKFYRKAAESLSLDQLEFGFDATTWQWLKLFLGNLALAVVTLGFGLAYWGYRNWAFMVRHLHVYGTINVSDLTQSTTHAPGEAEGLADAFDIGAI